MKWKERKGGKQKIGRKNELIITILDYQKNTEERKIWMATKWYLSIIGRVIINVSRI
jgi:hypothetical protein